MQHPGPPTVLYDADCGFCRWTLAKLLAWDRRKLLRAVAIDSSDGRRLLADLSPDTRDASWHYIDRDGERRSAGRAAAPLLRELHGGRLPAALLARFPDTTEATYEWVAEHRSTFGRAIPAGAIRRADARITSRR